jgi:hypothetical protein
MKGEKSLANFKSPPATDVSGDTNLGEAPTDEVSPSSEN